MFSFLSHVQTFSCEILLAWRSKYSYTCFSSHLCFPVIVLLIILLQFVFLVVLISLFPLFLRSFQVLVSVHPYLQCWRILFLLPLLPYITSLFPLFDIRYNASLVYFRSGLFVEVHIFRTLISILVNLNNAVIWMVSTLALYSKFSRSFINPLVTLLRLPITIGTTVTFMFHSFFQFPNKVQVLSLFSFFNFTQ